jgi:hypothetical protein
MRRTGTAMFIIPLKSSSVQVDRRSFFPMLQKKKQHLNPRLYNDRQQWFRHINIIEGLFNLPLPVY